MVTMALPLNHRDRTLRKGDMLRCKSSATATDVSRVSTGGIEERRGGREGGAGASGPAGARDGGAGARAGRRRGRRAASGAQQLPVQPLPQGANHQTSSQPGRCRLALSAVCCVKGAVGFRMTTQ